MTIHQRYCTVCAGLILSFVLTARLVAEPHFVAFTSGGQLAVARHGHVDLLDSGRFTKTNSFTIDGIMPGRIVTDPTGHWLAIVADWNVSLWELPNGKRSKSWPGKTGASDAVAFSRDGSVVAWASEDSVVSVWKMGSTELPKTLNIASRVHSLTFRRDGKSLAVGSGHESGGILSVIDIDRGRVVPVAKTKQPIKAVALSPDGQWFAAASGVSVHVWDFRYLKKYVVTEAKPITSLAFGITQVDKKGFAFKRALFPDSRPQWLSWGTDNGRVVIWPLGGPETISLRGSPSVGINSLSFDTRGKTIAAGTGLGFAVWGDVSSTSEVSRLDTVESNTKTVVGSLPREQRILFESLLPPAARLVVEVEHVERPPKIDGLLEDWQDARRMDFAPGAPYLTTEPVYHLRDSGVTEPAGTAGTAADLSGNFSICWDEKAFYLAAWVHDNVHDVKGTESPKWWHKDSVSFFLDVPRDGDGGKWIPGDHDFSFIADPEMPKDVIWWRHGDQDGHQEVPASADVRMAVKLTVDGYHLEAAIPMSVLTQITPEWQPPFDERMIGFMFIVTDPDGGPDPFGGELIFGGDNDDDGEWAGMRLVPRGVAAPPRYELSIPADPVNRSTDLRIVEILSKLQLPAGFRANVFANVPGGPSRMAFGPDGRMYVTAGGWGPGGEVWALADRNDDGIAEQREIVIFGLDTPLGLTWRDRDLYVTHRTDGLGRVSLYRDKADDNGFTFTGDVLTTGPGQGHGIGNIQVGPDDKVYVSQGSKGDVTVGDSRFDCTIWRMDPDGSDIEIVARGLRFAYGFAFDEEGNLFCTEQGPNHLDVPHFDELNQIQIGQNYGFPNVFTARDNSPQGIPPVVHFAEHTSACGMTFYKGNRFPKEYHGNALVTLWGPADPNHVDLVANPRPQWDSYYVARVEFDEDEGHRVSRFVGDFRHPIDVITGLDGAIYVADWGSTGINGSQSVADGDGVIFRIVHE